MKIAFLTTQAAQGSTVVGRVLPLARELAKNHEVSILVHADRLDSGSEAGMTGASLAIHQFGRDPFIRTASGKRRLKGLALIVRLKLNAWLAAVELFRLKPDVVVIAKSLPESVLAGWFAKVIFLPKARFVLDVDDFELAANKLTSFLQRAAVHWAQRAGARLAENIVAATPFLQDYFQQLAPHKMVTLIPTGTPDIPSVSESPVTPTLLYAGSVSLASGHRVDLLPDILRAVRSQHSDAKLVIAGSGDDVVQLKRQFGALGLTDAVEWRGRYQPSDVASLLAGASVVLDPIDTSVTNRAKSSFRVATAVAAGRPVVTSNVGIRSHLVPQQFHRRFFAQAMDADAYAEATAKLLNNPLTAHEQATLKQHAMRYTWDVLAKQYIAALT